VSVGYGHVLGAWVFGWGAFRRRVPGPLRSGLGAAFGLSVLATALAIHVALLSRWPVVAAPLLGLSLWHALENDGALVCFYAGVRERVRVGGGVGPALLLAGVATAAGAMTLAQSAVTGIGFAEFFAAPILYHLVSWIVLSLDRVRDLAAEDSGLAQRRAAQLVLVHAVPLALCAAAFLVVGAAGSLQQALLHPGIYLFWSGTHVVQTAWVRGLGPHAVLAARQ
jgi:cytochrome bd-type quinol oxidase subunit 2